MTRDGEPATFDTSVAHVARVYNYWLGGKDNFAADRAAGERAIQAFPNVVLSARANRAFLARAVRFLSRRSGYPPVPGHRDRHSLGEQHARGRPGGGAGIPDRLCGQ